MMHQATARPVSGKLMASTASQRAANTRTAADDVVDAEFETVERPSVQVRRDADGALSYRPGLEMLGRAPQTPAATGQSGGRLFWTVGACLIFGAFWVSGGHSALLGTDAALPSAPASALTLSGVSSRVDLSGERPVILVDGRAGNDGRQPADLPGLEIRVADMDGRVTHYKLGTSARRLAPGEQFAFSSRLDAPKSGVKTVSVTFAR